MKKHPIDAILPRVEMVSDAQTLLAMRSIPGSNQKLIEPMKGHWDDSAPMVVVDEKGHRMVLVEEEKLTRLMRTLRATQEESFRLNLEKTILQQMPVDFEDVWTVALRELQRMVEKNGSHKPVTGEMMAEAVRRIKRSHPNLFFNMGDLLAGTKSR